MNVFDFDNTIYDGESIIDFFFYYCKKDKKLLHEILKTKEAPDPTKAFCDKCHELGYKNITL